MSELNGVTRASWRVPVQFPGVVIRPRAANAVQHLWRLISAISKRLFELAVFNTRLYIRVRRFDEPA
jgi:hypothetical protein